MPLLIGESINLKHDKRDVLCCALAPSQSLLACGLQDGSIWLWDSHNAQILSTLRQGHSSPVNGICFNHDGAILASAGEDANVLLWDLSNISKGARFRRLEGHNAPLNFAVFSPNSALLATGGKDCDLMLWGNLGRPVCGRLRGHNNWVMCAAFSVDSTICVSGGYDHAVCVWNCVNFTIIRTIRKATSPILAIALSVENSVLAVGTESGEMQMIRIADGTVLRVLHGHTNAVTSICFAESLGTIFSSSWDNSVKAWTLRGECAKSFKAHNGGVLALALSNDFDFLVTTGADFFARVFAFRYFDDTVDEGGMGGGMEMDYNDDPNA